MIDAGLSGLVNQVFGQREPLLQLPIGRQSVALVLRVDDVSVLVDLESKDVLLLKWLLWTPYAKKRIKVILYKTL